MHDFRYTVDESKTWPPHGESTPPFGPGIIEIMRSCPLRVRFDATSGYEPRMGFAARIGTALHKVLQSLNQNQIIAATESEVAEEARHRFKVEMARQKEEALTHPREKFLPQDPARMAKAEDACMMEALRIFRTGAMYPRRPRGSYPTNSSSIREPAHTYRPVEVEIPVRSKNGLFAGRIDRVEHSDDGTRLFDYKSALRDDLPERYERQLQLYAYLWHEERGEWPVEAHVYYPLLGTLHSVNINQEICKKVAFASEKVIQDFRQETSASNCARPGDVCKVCEYRPWCKPFWKYQASEPAQTKAMEKATLGFAGKVEAITLQQHYWRLQLAWRNAEVLIAAPEERFPHLSNCSVGTEILVLDTQLRGIMYRPTAMVNEYTELFLVE